MERKNQNLEFTKKLSATKHKFIRKSNSLVIPNNPSQCSFGGDISVSTQKLTTLRCSDYAYDEIEHEDQDSKMKSVQSDESNSSQIDNSQKQKEISSKLKAELSKYTKELWEYTNTTKDLEDKYLKINLELNEMKQKHDRFVAKRKQPSGDYATYSDCSSTGSEYSLRTNYTQIFNESHSFLRGNTNETNEYLNKQPPKSPADSECKKQHWTEFDNTKVPQLENANRRKRRQPKNNENKRPADASNGSIKGPDKSIYRVLKNAVDSNSNCSPRESVHKVNILQSTIANLQNEHERFRTVIEQQQTFLDDYQSRCAKAHHVMMTQQREIEKLNANNHQLETDITVGIDHLRHRIETKLREVSQLPQIMRDEQVKHQRVLRENSMLNERIRAIQSEANQLKIKIEEIGRRKSATMTRLKATERDLKIFKNYNTVLKHEKRKLYEEQQKTREQMDSLQNSSKRTMNRQREQTEKQRRELQKRIFELEMKLSRSQNSTTSLIQERNRIIVELQSQLNTLVHNFEVSQKHIRVLRRHIYSMSGSNSREFIARNRVLSETA